MRPIIFRFTRDLRLGDHAGLAFAAARGPVVPVLVLDRDDIERLRCSPRRVVFFCNAVASLDASLRARGSSLIVIRGSLVNALKRVAREVDASGVVWSHAYDGTTIARDLGLQSRLEEVGLSANLVHDRLAIDPEETSSARPSGGDGYRAFAPYFDLWKSLPIATYEAPLLLQFFTGDATSEPLPTPAEFGAADVAAVPEAGEAQGTAMLARFLQCDALAYSIAANDPAQDTTSHLSAQLSFGIIAARTVVRATQRRLEDPFLLGEERASLRLFLRSIALRDFFLQLGHLAPQTDERNLLARTQALGDADAQRLDAWMQGRTGFPLVDAGIRQLRATGWMHPHVRAVAASFLCFDLARDWRIGRDAWNTLLVEDDPALASGNWQWIAGVGADMAQYPRIYNPSKQRRRFDPLGSYVRRFVPELAHVPLAQWEHSEDAGQLALSLFGESAYPAPILDHDAAARSYLARYRAMLTPRGDAPRSNLR